MRLSSASICSGDLSSNASLRSKLKYDGVQVGMTLNHSALRLTSSVHAASAEMFASTMARSAMAASSRALVMMWATTLAVKSAVDVMLGVAPALIGYQVEGYSAWFLTAESVAVKDRRGV